MLSAKKKITKKEIKEDKLVTSYYKFYNFFMENQKRFLIGLGFIAVIVVAFILINNKKKNDNIAAANLLSKVVPLYESGSMKEAIEGVKTQNIIGLKQIVDQYGSSEQGETAKIYLANAYSVLGELDKALEYYEDYSGSNEILKATALAGKAGILQSKKEFEKASDIFMDAAHVSKTNPSNAEYVLKAGICLLEAGKKEEAKQIFESIKKDYKNITPYLELDKYITQTEL
ncbi:MAG: tetratricopeptide repeat protein [Melioribacteraceae bacterium]|nr:tetratricopeptide repeat protein [Melioribacteraceae bacterium]